MTALSAGSKQYYDLAVAGAGPAGSLVAAVAARAGLKVLLLEKHKLPREKPCGGLVSARALSMLPPDLELPPEAAVPVYKVQVRHGSNVWSYHADQRLGLLVKREVFDLLLAEYARSKGACLWEESPLLSLESVPGGYRLETIKNGARTTVFAALAVGADGAFSRCARAAGLRSLTPARPSGWGCVCREPAASVEEPLITFFPLPFQGGLGWSFVAPGMRNRGVAGLVSPRQLPKMLARLFPGSPRSAASIWPLPFTGPVFNAAGHNLLLVGDAAGVVEPFSGEGLYNTLYSARLAGAAITAAGDGPATAGEIYRRAFRHAFRRRFAGSLLASLAFHGRAAAAPHLLPATIAGIMLKTGIVNMDLGQY